MQPFCSDELEFGPLKDKKCTGNIVRIKDGLVSIDSKFENCKHIAPFSRVITINLNGNAGAMFYHFVSEHLSPLFSNTLHILKNKYTLFVVQDGNVEQWREFYAVYSSFCPLSGRNLDNLEDVCLCDAEFSGEVDPNDELRPARTLAESIVSNLGLAELNPPSEPRLGLISRQNKRFLLNQPEMQQIAQKEFGIEVRILPLERMTLYEQLREIRQLHFLVGVHGSGLTNFMFLHPDGSSKYHSIGLQILPFRLTFGAQFFKPFCDMSGCIYYEWRNERRENSVMHFHFLSKQDYFNLEQLVRDGSGGSVDI